MSKETLIENLRGYKSTPRHCEELCYEAANEIESLRQQLAIAFEAGRVAEREECAKVLEKNGWLLQAADAIRARITK